MAMFNTKTPEQKAAAEADKTRRAAAAQAERERAQGERERQAFLNSPVGQAATAFGRGDHILQYAQNVMSQQAIIVAMVGSNTTKTTQDPTEVVNRVCDQGWELVNGSFVFVEEGQQSRDKFMSSGQNVAIKGATIGYYLFRRCPDNRRTAG
jgi:hypothetical protein